MFSSQLMELPSRFGGETRLIHVVYFLCRNGVVEQPHLIRIHHLHHSGVHLQDVKRWLSELRGKEVGESFAWSYKRRYKAGFVWQDLKDDELIMPISDNEYVLMGSELPHEHTNPLFETFTPGEMAPEIELELQLETTVNTKPHLISAQETLQIDRDDIISPKPSSRQDQDSPRATVPPITNRPKSPVAPPTPLSKSSSTSDASKQMVVIKVDAWKQNGVRVQAEKKRRQETEKEHSGACLGGKGGSGTCLGRKGGSGTCLGGKGVSCHGFYSGSGKKTSNVFQNLLKPCRAVNTDDSVMPGVHRKERDMLARGVSGEVCTYRRSVDGSNRHCRPINDGKSTRMARERVVSAVYMPAGEPNCSQCGKSFNPEKLHSHMKSCKALRRSRKD